MYYNSFNPHNNPIKQIRKPRKKNKATQLMIEAVFKSCLTLKEYYKGVVFIETLLS